jgi:hypothetical protein
MGMNVNTGNLKQLLLKHYHECRKETYTPCDEERYQIQTFKARLIELDIEEAFRLFSTHKDNSGLQMILDNKNTPEPLRRDCYDLLHPSLEEVKPAVSHAPVVKYQPSTQLRGMRRKKPPVTIIKF